MQLWTHVRRALIIGAMVEVILLAPSYFDFYFPTVEGFQLWTVQNLQYLQSGACFRDRCICGDLDVSNEAGTAAHEASGFVWAIGLGVPLLLLLVALGLRLPYYLVDDQLPQALMAISAIWFAIVAFVAAAARLGQRETT
jgi:hypothetical protein